MLLRRSYHTRAHEPVSFIPYRVEIKALCYVMLCTPTHEHQPDLNIEGGEGANVLVC